MNTPVPMPRVWPYVAVGASLLAILILTTLLYFRVHQERQLAEVQENLVSISNLKTHQLTEWVYERQGDAGVFFGNETFAALASSYLKNTEEPVAHKRIHDWVGSLQKNHAEYARIYFINTLGLIQVQSPDVELPADPCAATKLVAAEALRSEKIQFVDFHKHPDESIHLALVVPIFDPSTPAAPPTPLGCVVLSVNPNIYLYPMIQDWPTPSPTAETLLVRRDGDDALFLNELRFSKNSALNLRIHLNGDDIPAVHAVRGEQGLVNGVDYRGVPVVSAVWDWGWRCRRV